MKKKELTILGIVVTVLFLGGGGGLVGKFYKLLGRTEKIEEQVKETKEDVKEVEDEVDQEENINIAQSTAIQQIQDNQIRFLDEFKELQAAK